jgi:metal-responsive CopG/Arc/MetJ family transcriptional regulator
MLDNRYSFSHTTYMKAAISIPDAIFKKAEKVAHKLGMSRSELYTHAVASFIEERDEQNIVERLNNVYSSQSSTIDKDLYILQYHSLKLNGEKW